MPKNTRLFEKFYDVMYPVMTIGMFTFTTVVDADRILNIYKYDPRLYHEPFFGQATPLYSKQEALIYGATKYMVYNMVTSIMWPVTIIPVMMPHIMLYYDTN
jgi:hypothetical protein